MAPSSLQPALMASSRSGVWTKSMGGYSGHRREAVIFTKMAEYK